MTFTVNRELLNTIGEQEDTLYDRYTVTFRNAGMPADWTHTYTGTIPDVLAYILPTDIIVEVSRA